MPHILNKPQPDKVGQASVAFRQNGKSGRGGEGRYGI